MPTQEEFDALQEQLAASKKAEDEAKAAQHAAESKSKEIEDARVKEAFDAAVKQRQCSPAHKEHPWTSSTRRGCRRCGPSPSG
jgi:hypothetical protein